MRVVHLSWLKRSDGETGGVEKYADYLHRALTEEGHDCQIVAWADYPRKERVGSISNPDKALLLSSWVDAEFNFDIAVSDGYWGCGVTLHPVVPVIHGTWHQFHVNMGNPSPWLNIEVKGQHDAFNAVNAFPVACSAAAARELRQYHRRDPAATILHGVDLEQFYPRKNGNGNAPPCVLHAATNEKKGSAIMPAIARELAPDFNVFFLGAKIGEEPAAFQRGDIFLHPSKAEGNAFSLLEALATGLPIVTTDVGLFADIPDKTVGRVLPIGATVAQWAAAVREVWGDGNVPYRDYAMAARRTAKDMGDYNVFKRDWIEFLESLT